MGLTKSVVAKVVTDVLKEILPAMMENTMPQLIDEAIEAKLPEVLLMALPEVLQDVDGVGDGMLVTAMRDALGSMLESLAAFNHKLDEYMPRQVIKTKTKRGGEGAGGAQPEDDELECGRTRASPAHVASARGVVLCGGQHSGGGGGAGV